MDWRDTRPLLIRATAHLTILALGLTAVGLSGVAMPAPQIVAGAGGSSQRNAVFHSTTNISTEPAAPLPQPEVQGGTQLDRSGDGDTIARQAVPHTTFPDRPRAEVITHTVQQDETLWTIAAQYDLAPETIAWSNREAIQDAPWLIQPGLELFVLPVDGVYHTVREGDTRSSIAEEYGVDESALYNEWNDLDEDDPLQEGQLLVVPGGQGDEIVWEPPQPASTQPQYYRYSASSAPAPNNWFILPTGSRLVSGWYFHDPRNPTHIGLDYKCHLGDPLYAADSGIVTIAGWNGGYGILAEVVHGNGFLTRYGHFSQLAVSPGQPVHQGDVLGYCGSTGWSTGPHLHFEIRYNGVPQDPMAYQP
ncbi:MAG: LysM peptidoglycan-binding domain-containing M23 family metallopeptidase [Anaerolineae bacterium]